MRREERLLLVFAVGALALYLLGRSVSPPPQSSAAEAPWRPAWQRDAPQRRRRPAVRRDAPPPRSAAPDLRAIAEEKMAEEAADEEAAAKAEDDEAAAEEDAFPFSHLRDLARSDAPMAYSLVGHSRVSADGGAPVGGSGSALCDAKFDGPLVVTLTTVPVRVFGSVNRTLHKIFRQTLQPDEVILAMPKTSRRFGEG